MNRDLYVRRRTRRTDFRPGVLWLSLTIMLLAISGVGLTLARAVATDWLDLKLESARVRVMEMMPQPERPDFVPTPILVANRGAGSAAGPTAGRSSKIAQKAAQPAAGSPPAQVPGAETTAVAMQAPTQAPTRQPGRTAVPAIMGNGAAVASIQPAVQLTGVVHEAQRFNNCGPTTLRMLLSYFGYTRDTQVQIANVLKPNKDDRNVSPWELTGYAESKGFHGLYRVNGDLDRLKLLLSNNLPVMIEEGYDPPRAKEGWMGHYLLLTGYDEVGITAQDSYNGPNQHVAWSDVDTFWRNFNRTYLVLYTDSQASVVQSIVGEDMDDDTMYAKAAQRAQDEWNANPQDPYAPFNLGSSLVGLGEYDSAANAYDQSRLLKLPWRMMWYQFGPYEAYLHTGRYEEIVALADATLKPTGDLEESYYYKGLALEKLGRTDLAREAFQLALKYNSHYLAPKEALTALGF